MAGASASMSAMNSLLGGEGAPLRTTAVPKPGIPPTDETTQRKVRKPKPQKDVVLAANLEDSPTGV